MAGPQLSSMSTTTISESGTDSTPISETLSPPRSESGGGTPQHRLRVLHVIQNLNYGGMERLLADILRGLDRSRFEGHVMALQYLGRFAEGLTDVATLHLAKPMSRWSMLNPRQLAREIRDITPDVVHTHSGVWYKGSLAARMAGVPRVIHTEHGRPCPDPFIDRVVDRFAATRTDVVAAVSSRLRQQLIESGIASQDRIEVVRNGVDTELFQPRPEDGALRRELDLRPETPVIGSIGRLEPIKGFDLMIDAFSVLLADWTDEPEPVLVVCGDGSERHRLERMVVDRELQHRVRLLGWRNDITALHSLFTIFTMSSKSEGTSLSLLEAMSAGLCPIVTDVGGNADVLGDRLAHRLVPPQNPRALAAAWRETIRNPERRASDAKRARARVTSEFGLLQTIRSYEKLYARV